MLLNCFQGKYGDVELVFSLDEEEYGFYLKNEMGGVAKFNNPLDYKDVRVQLTARDYIPQDYEVIFLLKKDVIENDISTVRYRFDDGYRNIGFLIPAISLESTDHDYAEDNRFLLYSYIATVELLKKFPMYPYVKDIAFDDNKFNISDLISQDLVICIIWKKDIVDFTMSRLAVCLFEEGYVALSSRLPSELVFSKNNIESNSDETHEIKKFTIELLSSDVVDYALIEKILFVYFPYEKNPPFKFFLLYQIIELLMSYILQHEYDLILTQLKEVQQDNLKSRDVLDKIKEFTAEKKRLSLLFNSYSRVHQKSAELKSTSLAYVIKMIDAGISDEKNCEEYFYLIRNFIVHNMISLNEDNNVELEEVNANLISMVPLLLKTFKKRNQ